MASCPPAAIGEAALPPTELPRPRRRGTRAAPTLARRTTSAILDLSPRLRRGRALL